MGRCVFVGLVWAALLAACTPNEAPRDQAPAASSPTPGAGASSASAPPPSSPASANESALPPSAPVAPLPKDQPLRIGVTLHPYFSWTKNIVGDAPGVEVRAILPGDVDAGDYQPNPKDIQKLGDLQAVVVNGIGHDDFIGSMIKASGNAKLVIIGANDGTPTVKSAHGDAPNSHTFISFTNAIQETAMIEKTLAKLRPDLAETFAKNAAAYEEKLRGLRADAAKRLAGAKVKRVVTVHDGYAYFCQDFGVDVAGVVQPAHGLVPSAGELAAMSDLLKREKIEVVLTEEGFPEKLLETLKAGTNARVYIISHVASGEYTAEKFENEMKKNVDTLVKALVTDS